MNTFEQDHIQYEPMLSKENRKRISIIRVSFTGFWNRYSNRFLFGLWALTFATLIYSLFSPVWVKMWKGYTEVDLAMCPNNKMNEGKYAFVTLLTDENYLEGVRVLGRSLQNVNSKYPLIVLCTSEVYKKTKVVLEKDGLILKIVKPFSLKGQTSLIKEAWFKLRVWELVEYNKLLYLDSDTLVLKNLDHIFDLQLNSHFGIAAAKDWAQNRPYGEVQFNSGVMLLQPCQQIFHQMMEEMVHVEKYQDGHYADQLFLNFFWGKKVLGLPPSYNLLSTIQQRNPLLWSLKEAIIIHFAGKTKPWDQRIFSPDDEITRIWYQVKKSLKD